MSESESEIEDVATHSKALEGLKSTDPDFYEYLKVNDKDLLDFQDADSEEDEGESNHEALTASNFKIIKKNLQEKPNAKVCKSLIASFRDLVKLFECDKFADMSQSELFNDVIKLCLVDLVPAFYSILKVDPSSSIKKKSDPALSKSWKRMRRCIKSYLYDFLKVLAALKETSVLKLLLKHVIQLLPFFGRFPKMLKLLMKKIISIWSTNEESVRVVAFFAIMKAVKASPEFVSLIARNMYFCYVRNTKFTSPSTWPLINFMKQSLVQVYLLDAEVAYEHLFIYIRQLSIHLRNAYTTKKEDVFQIIFNWQYVHCIFLWAELICALHENEVIKSLIYPLVQVIIGSITLSPVFKYVPFRFHLIRCLIQISEKTGKFISVMPHILEVLTMTDFNMKSVYKPTVTNLKCCLKITKLQQKETGFRDGCIAEVCSLMMEYLKIYSHTIGFPELALPAIVQIKSFRKKCTVAKYNVQLKLLLDRLNENSEFVSAKRREINFKITDEEAIKNFEKNIYDKGTVILRHFKRVTKEEEANPSKRIKLES